VKDNEYAFLHGLSANCKTKVKDLSQENVPPPMGQSYQGKNIERRKREHRITQVAVALDMC